MSLPLPFMSLPLPFMSLPLPFYIHFYHTDFKVRNFGTLQFKQTSKHSKLHILFSPTRETSSPLISKIIDFVFTVNSSFCGNGKDDIKNFNFVIFQWIIPVKHANGTRQLLKVSRMDSYGVWHKYIKKIFVKCLYRYWSLFGKMPHKPILCLMD